MVEGSVVIQHRDQDGLFPAAAVGVVEQLARLLLVENAVVGIRLDRFGRTEILELLRRQRPGVEAREHRVIEVEHVVL